MGSIAAKKVAEEVLETIGKGKRPVLGKIIRKNGYAKNTADNPKLITETKSYQEVVNPVLKKYEEIRDKIIAEMTRKGRKLSKEKLISLTTALKNTTHDIQLLSGGKTEDMGVGELSAQFKSLIEKVKNADS